MIIISVLSVIIAGIMLLYIYCRRIKVVYEVQLFIRNVEGEVLLVYDQQLGRFSVPQREVLFDEIPTQIIQDMMAKLLGASIWEFDYSYHFTDNKYDRIRDDTGPIYIYDIMAKHKKRCVLCYLIFVEKFDESYNVKKAHPWPEFFSIDEINKMGEDIIPIDMSRNIILKLSVE